MPRRASTKVSSQVHPVSARRKVAGVGSSVAVFLAFGMTPLGTPMVNADPLDWMFDPLVDAVATASAGAEGGATGADWLDVSGWLDSSAGDLSTFSPDLGPAAAAVPAGVESFDQWIYQPWHTAIEDWINSPNPTPFLDGLNQFSQVMGWGAMMDDGADGGAAHPDGLDGGWLAGDGGDGWDSTVAGLAGGDGGHAGFFGNGGDGGAGGLGADGDSTSLLGGNGGDGGDGTAGGNGGDGGLWFGHGGDGGNGGDGGDGGDGGHGAHGTDAMQAGMAGGPGGDGGHGGDGGLGGNGGNAGSGAVNGTAGHGGDGGVAGDGGDGGFGGTGEWADHTSIGGLDGVAGEPGAGGVGGENADGTLSGLNGADGATGVDGNVGGAGGAGGLGGRLPFIDLNNADPAQLDLAHAIKEIALLKQGATGIQLIGPDGQLIGPFNAYLYNPEMGSAVLDYGMGTALGSDLPAPVREIVILSVGGLWGSEYELYAHQIGAQLAGVPDNAIEALANGEPPVGLTGDELIAAQFVQELVRTHHVGDELYQDAVDAFGQKGVVDMVHLLGAYLSTSALLNVFEVGTPGDGGVGDLGGVEVDLGGEVGDGGAAGGDVDGTLSGLNDTDGATVDGDDGGAGGLGGRLPLIDLNNADPAQQELASRIKEIALLKQEATGIQLIGPDGQLIGPFNAYLYNPEMGSAVLDYGMATALGSDLPAPVREIVILSVGGLWGSEYELYAHQIGAQLAGVPDNAIEALANGEAPVGLTGDELIAAQFVQELVRTHHVDDELYHAAEAAFGQKGVVDMVHLLGAYLSTAALLNTFEVPAPPSP